MYTVIELQTNEQGQTANIVQSYEDRNQAASHYHQILSFAAISNVRKHACALLNEDGFCEKSEYYEHIQEEPVEEQLYFMTENMTITTTVTISHEEMRKLGMTDQSFKNLGYFLKQTTTYGKVFEKITWTDQKEGI